LSAPRNLICRKGIWYARIQIAGRDTWRSLRTADEREARRRLKEVRTEAGLARAGLTPAPVEALPTWEEAVVRWSQVHLPGLRPATRTRYLCSLAQAEPIFTGQPISAITQAEVNAYCAARMEDGVTPATVRRDLTAISLVWRAAKRAGWTSGENPALAELEEIKELREAIEPVRLRDLALVLRAASPGLRPMIRFLALTGCRQEEAASLEWRNVDLAAGTVAFTKTKTRSPRVVSISPRTVALLMGLERARGLAYVFWHDTPEGGARYVNVASQFRGLVNRIYLRSDQGGAAAVSSVFRQPFRPFRCHDLRHTYAIRALQSGRAIYDVSRHLGHASVKTTEIYLRWLHHPVAKAVAAPRRSRKP
jgi:integrase